MNPHLQQLQQAIEPLRQQIIHHKVYSAINSVTDLQVFMRYHVYAVWDFMSLLKTLQNNLTCTSVPWYPRGPGDTRYLINEIVLGEEADVDQQGVRKSHFELYLDAMQQAGADAAHMDVFVATLQATGSLPKAFAAADTPPAAQQFVNFTFDVIGSGKTYLQSAIFTFGREDLIPGMFLSMVNDLDRSRPDNISTFKYYLERHIEVDGDHHSHLALQMTAALCGDDSQRWAQATEATRASLQSRIGLWDGVYEEIKAGGEKR